MKKNTLTRLASQMGHLTISNARNKKYRSRVHVLLSSSTFSFFLFPGCLPHLALGTDAHSVFLHVKCLQYAPG